MGILGGIERGQDLTHFVAPEALPLAGLQGLRGGIEGDELGLDRELMAGVTVELLLIGQRLSRAIMKTRRHPAQTNLDLVGQVTALLSAGGISRLETVGRARVTG
jgi:hypothetical protein